MFKDNVIWIDFRSRKSLILSSEKIKATSARTRDHIQSANSAFEAIKLVLERGRRNPRRVNEAFVEPSADATLDERR